MASVAKCWRQNAFAGSCTLSEYFPSSFSCDRKLLLVTLALEHDADSVDMKERAKYLGRRSKAIDWISTDSYSLDQLLYLDH